MESISNQVSKANYQYDVDPSSFENGLKPGRDLSRNAHGSLFFKLPAELRNITYGLIFTKPPLGEDSRRGQLSSSALRTCCQFYTEAVEILYGCNTHKISIEPDLAIFRAAPRIPSQFIATRNISMIRRLELEIQLVEEGASGRIHMEDITSAERHLRGICLSLSSSGAVLQSLKVEVVNGFMLESQAAFELLDGIREIRVDDEVHVLGIEECPWQTTHEYIQSLKDDMKAPDVVDDDGQSQITMLCMCQDLWDYLNLCTDYVKDWPRDNIHGGEDEAEFEAEQAAALEELRRAFEVEGFGRTEKLRFPAGSKPMEVFRAAILSIETIYANIDRTRFKEYHVAATDARERLYMRKAFREMVPYDVPNVFAFD